MFVLGLLTCIVLRAFGTQAKVVTSFHECRKFFYKDTEPRGMDQNSKKICQKYEQGGSYYATLYSVQHRIPLYSAYTYDLAGSTTGGGTDIWHLEPQISQPQSQIDYMVCENQNNQNTYKRYQATSNDYRDTGYDRGHLKPSSFSQSEDGRSATFTLTNAAPMDACFNRIHWKNWEVTLKSFLLYKLDKRSKAFIVTGTVPNARERIPEDSERVTVPSHIWTAVCFKHQHDDRKSFSFGFIGKNQPKEPGIALMTVSTLNHRLSELLNTQSVNIFKDDCFGDNDLDEVEERFKRLMSLPVKVAMKEALRNKFNTLTRAVSSNSVPANNFKLSELIVKFVFDTLSIYFSVAEELKTFSKSACLIINARKSVSYGEIDLRKRDLSERSDAVECLLVPENKRKTAADGSPCSSIIDDSDKCECTSEGKTKPCCSSSCLYQHKLKGYWCYSGQKQIECSPRYSLITVKGERCLDDHPCATYGYDYYWCKTGHGYIKDDWGYCSPPLWSSKAKNGKNCRSDHACAKYGDSQPWCYTDDGKKNQCCTSDDCFSAVNGKTCKPDHPCGYHGEKYLWCYTTDGKWDYCCKSYCIRSISS